MGLSYYQVAASGWRGYIRRSISDATLIDLFLFNFMYWIMDFIFYAPFLGLQTHIPHPFVHTHMWV